MSLTIRAYNVRFGDALLVSWDEDDGVHHAWIDFGNFHNDANAVFETVYEDVLRRTGGKLDLAVITHRHLDHLEGFHMLRGRFAQDFQIDRLWHAHVTGAVDAQFKVAGDHIQKLLPAAARDGDGELARIYRNNFGAGGISTKRRMDEILATLPYRKAHAVYRRSDASAWMPRGLRRLRIRVLAPERNSRAYLQPLDHALAARADLDQFFQAAGRRSGAVSAGRTQARGHRAEGSPLLAVADFARLRRLLRTGGLDLLGAVDRTRNNTSVVLALEYAGRRLLLTGDAEEASWALMRKRGVAFGSDVVKVGHHGSINASPAWAFEKVLPRRLKGNAAIVSTDPTRFTGRNEVPKREVLSGWRKRLGVASRLRRTDRTPLGSSVSIELRD